MFVVAFVVVLGLLRWPFGFGMMPYSLPFVFKIVVGVLAAGVGLGALH